VVLAVSVGEFQRRLHGAKYAQNDLKYFPLWVRRYAASAGPENGQLPGARSFRMNVFLVMYGAGLRYRETEVCPSNFILAAR
jgi:hypothetical protein